MLLALAIMALTIMALALLLAPPSAHAQQSASEASPEAPTFSETGPLTSDTGQVTFEWQAFEPTRLSITDDNGRSRPIYRGQGDRLFMSGLDDGRYRVELIGEDSGTGDAIMVEVRHQSLTRALLLTLLGGIVFLVVLAIILRGARSG